MTRRSALLCGALLVCLSLSADPACAQGETWTVTSEDSFPPYNFWMKGQRTGIDVAIVNAILKEIGATPVHQGLSWNEVVEAIDKNRVDLAFQFVATPQRLKSYHMVGPHRTGSTVLVARADFTGKFEKLSDLRGLRVGVVEGFSYTPAFDASDVFERVVASSNTTNFRRLMLGRVDLIAGDLQAIQYLAENDGMKSRIKVLPKALGQVPRYLALPLARDEKAARFQAAYEKLKADGTIDRIIRDWQPP
ncbi:substrate-binding periplasmic protein [Paracraurococcus lichenis]|uniref:ABC transporter substrate-binding protein n=1 Tax=Paracraurococcus lichenis TaxID=3064888 RepID=A0ABT9E944_9PROT|nr:ABC transporter substrate-binding protein [Paracraurococcus sp. LOR1-02]MDO9712717.1 ABC transporter substrate-binding protein [Paracraurococcus sp. LOR1-02]